jgi:quercetin dioxygenase-like cupin family protein
VFHKRTNRKDARSFARAITDGAVPLTVFSYERSYIERIVSAVELQEEIMMKVMTRRSAVALGMTTAAAAPLFGLATPAGAAGIAPTYGPDEGKELSPGRRRIEVGTAPSEMAAYKEIKVIDIVYQPGAVDPKEAVMDMDMMCFILAGEFTIKKMENQVYTVKEGDFYTCGKGRTDHATNISNRVGIHRIALMIPA